MQILKTLKKYSLFVKMRGFFYDFLMHLEIVKNRDFLIFHCFEWN